MESELVVVRGGSLHRGSRYVLRVTERGKDLARLTGLVDGRGRPVRGMPVAGFIPAKFQCASTASGNFSLSYAAGSPALKSTT